MSSKHFLNDASQLVSAALGALALTNPHVAVDAANKIVYRRRAAQEPPAVAVVSGGGSGHEPSFGGLVGPGMLAAAVAGSVFASPGAAQVRAALGRRVDGRRGVLAVVMNYTGDVLNFGVAVEKARAAGLRVDMVVVGDDVGVGRARLGRVGRRGIAGTVLVLKMAGALAAAGRPLADVARVARLVAANVVSVGASLARVHVPGHHTHAPDEEAEEEAEEEDGDENEDEDRHGVEVEVEVEVEVGMGIHNEPGSARARLRLPQLVATMLAQLLDPRDRDRAFLAVDSPHVVLLVNNLGGVSVLELGAITAEVVAQLRRTYAIRPVRVLSGAFMTSLNGLGFSISLLNVVDAGLGHGLGMLALLDAPSEVTGWSAPVRASTWESSGSAATPTDDDDDDGGGGGGGNDAAAQPVEPSRLTVDDPARAQAALTRALQSVVAAEPDVTNFDTVVGDGDCGTGLKRGAQAILRHIGQTPLTGDAVVDVASIVPVVENTMDGTSGALYAIFLNALVHALRGLSPGRATPRLWAEALEQSCRALSKYTPARPGDRTVVDALYPFVDVLGKTGDVQRAAVAAKKAADGTRGMQASLGRSVYVGGSGYEQVPDPGAWGLACFFLGLAGAE